ncbi:MAG: hypothetical protein QM784_11920 [Polyangiaceae bacterium]
MAPSPAALTDVQERSAASVSGGSPSPHHPDDNVEHGPQTLAGIADPKARTLMGFGPAASPRDGMHPTARPDDEDLAKGKPLSGDAPKQSAFKGTLMGVSPFVPGSGPPSPASPGLVHPGPEPTGLGSTVNIARTTSNVVTGSLDGHRTMVGVAPPTPVVPATDDEPRNPSPPHHKETLLGVAMPGIAPLNPGAPKSEEVALPPERRNQAAAARQSQAPGPRRATPTPTPTEQRRAAAIESATRAAHLRALQRRRLAWILGGASTLLGSIVAVAAFIWWNSVHLTVKVGTAENNDEFLSLTCNNCPDGTTVHLDGKAARFTGGKTELALAKRLSVGTNPLALEVKRPSRTRSEVITAMVPVEFRVTTNLASLAKDPPQLTVTVEAIPQTRFQMSGRTYTVGPEGNLAIPVDVTNQLSGPSAAKMPLEQKLDYTVIGSDGTQLPGSLVTRLAITPLEITAPGLDYITANSTFTLSGRTSPKAKLSANGHPLSVSSDGTFRQDMALSAPGTTRLRIRTIEDGLAPRIVDIALERVTNLRQRADQLASTLYTTYDAISELVAGKPNSLVALHGEVVAVDRTEATTRVVVSASCVRSPCLATIGHGAPVSFNRGVPHHRYWQGTACQTS